MDKKTWSIRVSKLQIVSCPPVLIRHDPSSCIHTYLFLFHRATIPNMNAIRACSRYCHQPRYCPNCKHAVSPQMIPWTAHAGNSTTRTTICRHCGGVLPLTTTTTNSSSWLTMDSCSTARTAMATTCGTLKWLLESRSSRAYTRLAGVILLGGAQRRWSAAGFLAMLIFWTRDILIVWFERGARDSWVSKCMYH
jgi:hypothetical protein